MTSKKKNKSEIGNTMSFVFRKIVNVWFIFLIVMPFLFFATSTSNACAEYKVTWMLLEFFMLAYVYRQWEITYNEE